MVTGKKEEEVTPPEDLMREHGVLDRVLLLYEAAIRKFSSNDDFDPALVVQSAEIVRDFINNYHEKSEEDHVFPRFKKAGKMGDLVDTLLRQHEAGRNVTQTIIRLAPSSRSNADDRKQLVGSMQSFITMYRPHAAREDTDLFPKLKDVVSSNEYDAMAEEFEKKEHDCSGRTASRRWSPGSPNLSSRSASTISINSRRDDDDLEGPLRTRSPGWTILIRLQVRWMVSSTKESRS
jgi:hemerythrin-like domain-containing protein